MKNFQPPPDPAKRSRVISPDAKARDESGKFREGRKYAWEMLAQVLARAPLVKE